jgi:CelD/BcsL family acetyltransferase involved in cellulose biosynthesis
LLALRRLESIADLRQKAQAWDDLWCRSDVAAPTARAELLAQWLEHFAPRTRFCAVTIEHEGSLAAALPLVGCSLKGLVEVANLPGNDWFPAGELLLDPNAPDKVLSRLAGEIARLPWRLVSLKSVKCHAPAWQRLLSAATEAGLEVEREPAITIGWTDLGPEWSAYEAGISKNLRKQLRRTRERLLETAPVELELHEHAAEAEIPRLVRQVFEVEDRSWKGAAGTSVLRSPGILGFYETQAAQLGRWDSLDLLLLRHGERAMASAFGYRAKGISFCQKIGYDETYASFSPGQHLMMEMFRRFHTDPARRSVDFLGPVIGAIAKWTTSTYVEERLVLAPKRMSSRLLLAAYRAVSRTR